MLRINLLQEYHRRQRPAFSWRAAGFGFLLGVLVSAAAAMFFFRPSWLPGGLGGQGGQGPDAPVVVANPDPGEQAGADAVIHGDSRGYLGGEVQLGGGGRSPAPSTPAGGQITPEDHPPPAEIVRPGATSRADSERPPCPGGLHPGDRVDVPVQGSIHTVWVDSRTGAVVGQGDHPVEGTTTVAVDEDLRLRVDTAFEDSVEIAIDLPERRWWAGVFGAAGFGGLEVGLFVDYRTTLARFPGIGADLVVGGTAEVYHAGDGLGGRVAVRVGVAF